MSAIYDAIVIGSGHNGLVAATRLAKAGRKVLLLERRKILGGIAATEELFPGFHFNIGALDAGMLLPQVIDGLDLVHHGLELIGSPVAAFDPISGLTIWQDVKRTQDDLGKISKKDADAWPEYTRIAERFAAILARISELEPFALHGTSLGVLASWAKLALKLRGMGGKDMMEFLRVLPMSAYQFLNERFESEALKGMLSSVALTGLDQGPRAAGTAFMLLYQQIGGNGGGYRSTKKVRGGTGALIYALEKAAQNAGVEIRTDASVASILAENGKINGVRLQGGEEIAGKAVLSSADPRTTFLDLVGRSQLSPRTSRRVRNLKLRGTTANIHLALSGLPDFPAANGEKDRLSGAIVVSPSIDYAERAHDDAKYGRIAEEPIFEARIPSLLDPSLAPSGQHTMSITLLFAPYWLREMEWNSQRERLGDIAVETLAKHSPNLEGLITNRHVITPMDYESEYGLAEGSTHQGQMSLDQLLLMRPVPGFVGYRSPIKGLYLCGAGAHPGGGITGAPGWNAAGQAHRETR